MVRSSGFLRLSASEMINDILKGDTEMKNRSEDISRCIINGMETLAVAQQDEILAKRPGRNRNIEARR